MTTQTDHRYSVRLEWCGYEERKWVARFLGEWLGKYDTSAEAIASCQEAQDSWLRAFGVKKPERIKPYVGEY